MKEVQFNTMGSRRVLSGTLSVFSRWAIKKHGIKTVVIAGRHGTKLTGELISEMLTPDYVVRRQLEKPFWDYSIPLSILGYEDRKRSVVEWGFLLIRSFFRLLLLPSNPSWVVLQMNTYKEEIAAYWANIVSPDILVLVHPGQVLRELEQMLLMKTRKFAVISSDKIEEPRVHKAKIPVYTVCEDETCDLQIHSYRENGTGVHISGEWRPKNEKIEAFAFQRGAFMREPIALSLSVILGMGHSSLEAVEKLKQAQIDIERFIYTAPTD